MQVSSRFTVLFEDPFWVGIYERTTERQHYEVAKVVFGPEPKDYEVHQMILEEFNRLRFSKAQNGVKQTVRKINPKRLHKQIKKELQNKGVGTKAQNAIKQQHEANKIIRKASTRDKKRERQQEKFRQKQVKKKKKHRGH